MTDDHSRYERDPSAPQVRIDSFRGLRRRARRGLLDETGLVDLRDFVDHLSAPRAPGQPPVLWSDGLVLDKDE